MCRVLDRAAEEHWQRHGWLWLRAFLGDEVARDLAVWTDEIAAWPEVPGRWMRYYERRGGDAAAKMLARIENFVPYHERLAALFTGPRVLGLTGRGVGEIGRGAGTEPAGRRTISTGGFLGRSSLT